MHCTRRIIGLIILYAAISRAGIILTPANVCELAVKNNCRLKAAVWNLQEGREERKEAFTGFLPKFSTSASYKHTSGIPGFSLDLNSMPAGSNPSDSLSRDAWQMLRSVFDDLSNSLVMGSKDNCGLSISMSQPIFAGFRILNGYRLAAAEAEAREWERKKTEQIVIYSALSLYWTAYALDREIVAARDEEERLSSSVKFQELRYSQKLVAEYELLQMRAALAKSHAAVARSEQRFRSTQRKLLCLLALDPFTPATIAPAPSDTLAVETVSDLQAYLASCRSSRPDMQKERAQIHAAELKRKIAGADLMPSVNLSADYTYARPNELVSFSNTWQKSWCVGVLATWNIFDWGAAGLRVKEAELRKKSLEDASRADEGDFLCQAVDAWEAVQTAKTEFAALGEAADAMETSCRAMEQRYRQSEVSVTDYLLARAELTQAKSAREYARARLLLSIENMKIGGLGER